MGWFNARFTNLAKCRMCGWILKVDSELCPCMKRIADRHVPFKNRYEDSVIRAIELPDIIDNLLITLNSREEKILRMRYGLDEPKGHTYTEIASDFRLTPERVRQIESRALSKLRHPSRRRRLNCLIDYI